MLPPALKFLQGPPGTWTRAPAQGQTTTRDGHLNVQSTAQVVSTQLLLQARPIVGCTAPAASPRRGEVNLSSVSR